MNFDNIVSLGFNCEISFRIEYFLGKLNSMPFSWALVEDKNIFPKLIGSLDEMIDSISVDNTEYVSKSRMILCKNYGISFHPRKDILFAEGKITEESFSNALGELIARLRHLSDKFNALFNSNQKTLFVLKVREGQPMDNISFIQNVYNALDEKMVSGSFTLLVVMEKKSSDILYKELESNNLIIRYINRYASQKYSDTLGDFCGWYRILKSVTGVKSKTFYPTILKKIFNRFFKALKKRVMRLFSKK